MNLKINNRFKILNIVALLKDFPDKKLLKGQVGTIVEDLGNNVYEIEFINNMGETIAMASIEAQNLLLLHYELETV